MSFDEDDPRADDVRQIIKGGRRAAALTEELRKQGAVYEHAAK